MLRHGTNSLRRECASSGHSRAAWERVESTHSGRPALPAWTRSLPGTIIGVEPCAGTTMNVAQWLNAIDLGQYEALFREHEIDAGVLRDLVEADLEKIGVPLGHRKRLLKAIAALGTGETAAKPPSPPACIVACDRRTPPDHSHVL